MLIKCWLLLVTSNTSCWNGDCDGEGCKRGLCCTDGDGLGVKNGPGGDRIPKTTENKLKSALSLEPFSNVYNWQNWSVRDTFHARYQAFVIFISALKRWTHEMVLVILFLNFLLLTPVICSITFTSTLIFFRNKAINISFLNWLARLENEQIFHEFPFPSSNRTTPKDQINLKYMHHLWTYIFLRYACISRKAPFFFLHHGWATTHIIKTTKKKSEMCTVRNL